MPEGRETVSDGAKDSKIEMTAPVKSIVHSYSSLHTYEHVCPYQWYRRYIVRDLKYVETPERKKGNLTHDALALRVGAKKPLPDWLRHLEPWAAPLDTLDPKAEGQVGVTATGHPVGFFDKDVWLRGALDVTIVQGNTGFILDWKDGKSRWVKRFELDVHAVLLHARHPELRTIKAQYCFTTENHLSEVYDCSDTAATWQEISKIATRIEFDRMNESFEKRKNPLCGWCECFDCENNTNPKAP